MCERDDLDGFAVADRGMSRRKFGLLALGAGMATACASMPLAGEAEGRDVEIRTADGTADAYLVHPAGGEHPGVLMWPDIFGLRPAFKEMARRLASAGYAVLVVNPFYRTKRAPTAEPGASMNDPATREALMSLRATLSAATAQTDARAFVAWLDQQPAVDRRRRLGTAGYCMGGPLVMQTAASVPERVGAGASFHGGGLATDKPDSPHRRIPGMNAQFLVAIAENDDAREPAVKDVLREAFSQAGLRAEIEVYAGTKHGWCPTDSPVYHPDQAERAWGRMLDLFGRAL